MATIVGIHGIAQQFQGRHSLGMVWYDALRDGLAAAGYRPTAELLEPSDVAVVFFGDLFRPPGTMAVQEPPFSAADIQPGLERDLLTVFYQAAVAEDRPPGVPGAPIPRGRGATLVMLDRLTRSRSFARLAERAFIGNLKQVTAFLTDSTIKQSALARVREQINADTRVVIGHSLGSVVAYEYLCHDHPPSVETFVTLGSPLGIPNLVFDRLSPPPVGGIGAWPDDLAAWVNVADPHDVVALRKDLAPLFRGTLPGQVISDRLVDNGDQPHAVDRYLNASQTGSALGNVLR